MNDNVIVSKKTSGSKLQVLAPNGRWASPYRVEGRALVKRVSESHIFKAKQAVGIDEAVWQSMQESTLISFALSGGTGASSRYQLKEFESKSSFVHGDGLSFAVTRFVPISALKLVRERPPVRGQLSLFAGVGV
jgi:hypothetical protein